ncbi:MAG: hypothetical protein QXY53_03535 [Desulfurococcaceae archaeon]
MTISKKDVEKAIKEKIRYTRWWPFKDKNVSFEISLHKKFGDMGYVVIRVNLDNGETRYIQFPYVFTRNELSGELINRSISVDDGFLIEAPYKMDYFVLMNNLVEEGLLEVKLNVEGKLESEKAEPLSLGSTNAIGKHSLKIGSDTVESIVKSYTTLSKDNIEPLMISRLDERKFEYSPKLIAIYRVKPGVISENDKESYVSSIIVQYIEGERDAGKPFADDIYSRLVSRMSREKQISSQHDEQLEKFAVKIGRIVADMHYALNVNIKDELFGLVPIDDKDIENWINNRIETYAENISKALDNIINREDGDFRKYYENIKSRFNKLYDSLKELIFNNLVYFKESYKGRIHGDLHFLQMVRSRDKVYIVDFEGEPHRAGRITDKEPLVRDIATLCNSLVYIWFFQYKDAYCRFHRCERIMSKYGDRGEEYLMLKLGWKLIERNRMPPLYDWVIGKAVLLSLSYGYRIQYYKKEVDLHGFKQEPFVKNYAVYLSPWIFERALYEMWYELSYRPYQAIVPLLTLHYPPLPYIKYSGS